MAVIRILDSGKTVPYNQKTASMFDRAIKSGAAVIDGDFEVIEPKKKVEELAELAELEKVESVDYNSFTIKELREIAKNKGLSAGGSKAELVDRLS
jgi:hypothetical protein